MLELGTLLVAAGAYLGIGLLVWLAPDLEPDGTSRVGLRVRHKERD